MKVVTLKIPVSQSMYDTAKFAVEDGLARIEEEFLARAALKGIFSDFFEDRLLRLDLSGYLDEAIKNVYTEELAGETRQDSKEGQCEGCICADCCECSRGMTDMYTPKKGRRDRA